MCTVQCDFAMRWALWSFLKNFDHYSLRCTFFKEPRWAWTLKHEKMEVKISWHTPINKFLYSLLFTIKHRYLPVLYCNEPVQCEHIQKFMTTVLHLEKNAIGKYLSLIHLEYALIFYTSIHMQTWSIWFFSHMTGMLCTVNNHEICNLFSRCFQQCAGWKCLQCAL